MRALDESTRASMYDSAMVDYILAAGDVPAGWDPIDYAKFRLEKATTRETLRYWRKQRNKAWLCIAAFHSWAEEARAMGLPSAPSYDDEIRAITGDEYRMVLKLGGLDALRKAVLYGTGLHYSTAFDLRRTRGSFRRVHCKLCNYPIDMDTYPTQGHECPVLWEDYDPIPSELADHLYTFWRRAVLVG